MIRYKTTFESVIARGGFDLTEMLNKIDSYHIEGRLDDAERDELYALARGQAKMLIDVQKEIQNIWAAIRELQKAENDTETEGSGESDVEAIADYVQPTGAHDAYQRGDKVLYNGITYACVMDNCVWAPDVLPKAWEAVEESPL